MTDSRRCSPLRALGRLCDAMCGAAARRRQASKVLTRARQKCIELRDKDASRTLCVSLLEKFKDDAGDDDLPLQHLRAAEQHLAAVERWLRGQGHEEGAENLRKELGVSEAQRRMSSSPEAIEFTQNFADIEGEVFVQALTGSVKVKSFRHPGKVFITNVRLCFFSCVLGVEVSCSVKWEEIASLRLVDTAHAQTYPVLVYFKDEIEFDGQGVKELDLRIFEFADLGALQKSATYFVGADLFGIYEEAEAKKSAPATASPAITRLERTSSLISPEAVLKELSMWELERRTNLFKSNWKAPYFPHDGVGKMKWVSFEDNSYSRHPFIPEGVDEQKISASETPPVEVVEFLGERRRCTWSTFPVEGETDELGWQYSTDFVLGNTGWLPYCASMSFVRRRCWKPSFYTDAEDDAKARDRAPTTILQNKDSKGAKFPIFEQVLGEISLEVLGQSLLTDDWRDPDCLMNFYWEEMGSVDLEISAWSDGSSFASVVKGKVRTIEMRSPVPPAPMCPKETRVQSTWHVVILEDKVLLESVSMSLDVPCGTNFNVIACDTFSVQDGKLKMVRTCGIEWLQNTWLKSMIEQNVPPQLAAVGERMAKVVGRWWQKAGSSQDDGDREVCFYAAKHCHLEGEASAAAALWRNPDHKVGCALAEAQATDNRSDIQQAFLLHPRSRNWVASDMKASCWPDRQVHPRFQKPVSVSCSLMLMLPTWACWLPLLAAVGMGGDAVSEALLGGRSAFVRFYAPWCGHSQAMQPAWQQLAKAYQSSGDIVISDVDCTAAENEELCRDQSIESYPTLKYFNVETGHAGRTYADARDYESLRRVAERVMMRCVPSTKQDCDARQKAYIERMRSAGAAAREQELRRLLRLSGSEPSTARRAWLSNRIALLEGLGGQTVKVEAEGGDTPEIGTATTATTEALDEINGNDVAVLASGIEEVTIEFTDVLSDLPVHSAVSARFRTFRRCRGCLGTMADAAKRQKAEEADAVPEQEPQAKRQKAEQADELTPVGTTDAEGDEESKAESASSDDESDTSSSSSSSDSSESSSDEESEAPAAADVAEAPKEAEDAKAARHLGTIRLAQLKRGELVNLLRDLPPEEHDSHIKSAFVLVKVSEADEVMAEVVCAEPSAVYHVQNLDFPKEVKVLKYQLRCKRGTAEKLIKASAVSNGMIEEKHLKQWKSLINRCKIDPELILDNMQERAQQICRSKAIKYDEAMVARILSQKKPIEFDAQKQSRMAAQVQIGLTQMDISSIREFEVLKLGKEHEIAKQHLHQMQRKEYEKHEEWFQHARGLFSAKEVNRMNHDRQVRDDRHALQYALDNERREDAETGRLNPFERRACRPVSAWDTRLSQSEELEQWKLANVALRLEATRAAEAEEQNVCVGIVGRLEPGYVVLASGEGGRGNRANAWMIFLGLLLTCLVMLPSHWALHARRVVDVLVTSPPVVVTTCGRIQGRWEAAAAKSIAAFRGIQFGTAIRWMPPSLACPSTTIATADGPACFQHDPSRRHAGQSEECLFLHGGGLQGGDASGYNGIQNLVALSGDIILVACQYRLGVLGFMATSRLSERDPRGVSGNYGFLDQQLCLRWVQQHVAAFGGDTENVTLLGHSAGATTINAHLAAPKSVGLFHRAILLSGSPGTPKLSQREKELQDTSLWLPSTGCMDLECLLNCDAGRLSDSLPQRYRHFDQSDYPTAPAPQGIAWAELLHVDGVSIPWPAAEAFRRARVPLVVQTMEAEMAGSSAPGLPDFATSEAFLEFLRSRHEMGAGFGPSFVAALAVAYAEFEPNLAKYALDSNSVLNKLWSGNLQHLENNGRETGNGCGYRALAQLAAAGGSQVHMGMVRFGPTRPVRWRSDCTEIKHPYPFHGWELAAATGAWSQLWFGACEEYVPSSEQTASGEDASFGDFQRKSWRDYEFLCQCRAL
ncbi:Acylcarnitine hydrolase [Symbiodinium microadriaticum]|uniref:Acylcarnitine hydrolase n=1 Tax=Symbiodinium microadriaticum TaxID=2951 RepID=A0A1Q9EA77_SYMMI|nr:Acylcarnitine hydrolase [Symbiodinium microadriaticum]